MNHNLEYTRSICPGQVNFPAGEELFIITWPMDKGRGKLSATNKKKKLRAACLKGKLEFKFFGPLLTDFYFMLYSYLNSCDS